MFEKLDSLMFENIGSKIKSVIRAYIYFVLALLVGGGALMELYCLWQLLNGNPGAFVAMLLVPIAVALSGFLVWWSQALVYGFAELIENSVTNRQEKEASKVYKPMYGDAAQKVQSKARTASAPAGEGSWRCTCGKVNPKYMSTCSCGKSAREVRERKNDTKSSTPQNNEVAKAITAAEEKAIAMGVCPDCGATLEKTDMDSVMMCSDCGRMFG